MGDAQFSTCVPVNVMGLHHFISLMMGLRSGCGLYYLKPSSVFTVWEIKPEMHYELVRSDIEPTQV